MQMEAYYLNSASDIKKAHDRLEEAVGEAILALAHNEPRAEIIAALERALKHSEQKQDKHDDKNNSDAAAAVGRPAEVPAASTEGKQ